jgi:2',3'-cyclic-nucleotide 2'-phosphodiesterase (5'-nucleotidase family)
VIWLDSGDLFQGAPIFNRFSGEPEIRAMSELKLDAFSIGNHDFDLGTRNAFDQYGTWANFPVLASNYWTEDPELQGNSPLGDLVSDTVVLDVKGLRVLIVGLGNRSSMTSLGQGGNSVGVTPLQSHEVTQSYINMWSPYVDVVIGLSHLGADEDKELVLGTHRYFRSSELPADNECADTREVGVKRCRVRGVRGLDLVFGGHHHIVFNPPLAYPDPDGRIVPIVHSGAFLQFLGRLDVITRPASLMEPPRSPWFGREILDHRYQVIPVDSRTERDAQIQRRLAPYVQELALSYDLQKPIAFAAQALLRRNPDGQDSVVGNLVAEAMRTRAGVETDFVVTNSLGIRDNIYQGPITSEVLFNVFPFENTITTLFLSGQEVQEMLNFIAGRSTARGCQTQVQVSGIEYVMRCDCAVNSDGCCATATRYDGEYPKACAENIRIGGQPLNPNGTYEMGANDYIASGGSGFEMLRRNTTQRNTGIAIRTAVEEYLGKFPTCTEVPDLTCTENDPETAGCKLERIVREYGPIPCVKPDGIIDGRIQSRVAQ